MGERRDIERLTWGDKDVFVVGTAHVSEKSAELVENLITEYRPDSVCVELCPGRYEAITQRQQWLNTNLIQVIKQKKAFLLLAHMMLAYFQKKIGAKLGVTPGEEMLRAIKAAEQTGAHLHLADRDIRVTLARAWRLMGWWSKVKLLVQFVLSAGEIKNLDAAEIEKLKERDILAAVLAELGESLPEIRRVVIDERDLYLAEMIRRAPGRKVVAVVGAGHLPGIKRAWGQQVDLEALTRVPPAGPGLRLLKWALPLFILTLIAAGFLGMGREAGTHMLTWWVLANGVLAGLGAALALANPLTILSAVAAAPLTSLNPMIAAGWVAGLVEAFVGKPRVRDFENLPEDISSLRGFWRNKITRILLVVVLTNLGSTIGTFIAIPLMLKVFS